MRLLLKMSILPVLGVVGGYAVAYAYLTGMLVSWRYAGNPGEKIAYIVGLSSPNKLIVVSETGKIYTLVFETRTGTPPPMQFEWKNEFELPYGLYHSQDLGAGFITRPLTFKPKQLIDFEYPLVEGVGLIKFALSRNGKIWMWDHASGGFSGIFYLCFPVIGFVLGWMFVITIWWVSRYKQPVRNTNGPG